MAGAPDPFFMDRAQADYGVTQDVRDQQARDRDQAAKAKNDADAKKTADDAKKAATAANESEGELCRSKMTFMLFLIRVQVLRSLRDKFGGRSTDQKYLSACDQPTIG